MNKESTILWLFSLPKQSRVALLFTAMAFSFSLFLLMPLDLYLNNTSYFNIGLVHVGLPLLVLALILFAAIAILVPIIFGGKYVDIFTMLLFGITLACYVQVLFLNGNMEALTGDIGNYTNTFKNTLNVLVWLFIAILPLNLWAFARGHEKFKHVKWGTGIIAVSIIILGMQTAGIFTEILKYKPINLKLPLYASIDKSFELSSNENICVFIMDRMAIEYMDGALKKYPALTKQLDGFTYYKNNVAEYNGTFPAVITMLTNFYYNYQYTIEEYIEKAWGEHSLIDILRDNGYVSTLLLSKRYTYGDLNYLYNRAENIVAVDVLSIDYKYSEIIKATLMISFGRISPYVTKELFIGEILVDFSSAFVEIIFADDDCSESYMQNSIGNKSDRQIFNRLKTVGLSTPYEENVFTVVHLFASHDGKYHYNEKTDSLERGGSRVDSTYGSFAILNKYFSHMKELGIYDQATIFIIADHGRSQLLPLLERDHELERDLRAALLIKPKNAQGGFHINETAQLSHINFYASILEMANIPNKDYGLSYNDIISDNIQQTRVLNMIKGGNSQKGHYVVTGDAADYSNWVYFLNEGR